MEFINLPVQIEKRSFEIIKKELLDKGISLDPELSPVILRVIHASADFEYAESLYFSKDAVPKMKEALSKGASIVTDTEMAKAGISHQKLERFGGKVYCFMKDERVREEAMSRGATRASVSMEYASRLHEELIFAIGNAPTALLRILQLMEETDFRPSGIIGVPVGFVNVIEAKERLIREKRIPVISSRGRKGGSSVAAAICNALLYSID